MAQSIEQRLEQYTIARSQEVLVITAQIDGESERILIFKGFSSSLTHPTAFDPDIPVLRKGAEIVSIDRAVSPYNPDAPQYIERGLSLAQMESLLVAAGL